MEIVGRFILRLLLVPLGAAVATCIAVLVLAIAHWNAFRALAEAGAQEDYLFTIIIAGPILAMLLSWSAAMMCLPAAVGVLISETFAVRSWIYHAANGGLSVWIGWSLIHDVREEYRLFTEPTALVAAGIAGGLAYWLVAGSSAGFWQPFRQRPQSQRA